MLNTLSLHNTGPAAELRLDFAKRLNLLTGDNGLGKSFVLDTAWWVLTRTWSGPTARPMDATKPARIGYAFDAKTTSRESFSKWSASRQTWGTKDVGRPPKPGLVLYAQVDGGFSVWDPARNYWRLDPDRPDAYILEAAQVWNGLDLNGKPACNGLIRDWASWQKAKGHQFELMKAAIEAMSPSKDEPLRPGKLTRVNLDDVRDTPTIRMPYGQDVPIVHASAGIRRTAALAYLLVWAWTEHAQASKLLGHKTTSQIIFLIDEIEAHLHPRWQRTILDGLFAVVRKTLKPKRPTVQIIAATHSPLILASAESMFDVDEDRWLDFDLTQDGVTVTEREFIRHGDASGWLTSEAFDLPTAYSLSTEKAIEEASALLGRRTVEKAAFLAADRKLHAVLSDIDPFWIRWRYFGEKKGFVRKDPA